MEDSMLHLRTVVLAFILNVAKSVLTDGFSTVKTSGGILFFMRWSTMLRIKSLQERIMVTERHSKESQSGLMRRRSSQLRHTVMEGGFSPDGNRLRIGKNNGSAILLSGVSAGPGLKTL